MHGQQNDKYTEMHGQQNDKYTEMHGQQNDKYTKLHGQQNDKYTEMHGQQNDKYTKMHGQQNVSQKTKYSNILSTISWRHFQTCVYQVIDKSPPSKYFSIHLKTANQKLEAGRLAKASVHVTLRGVKQK